MENHKDKIQEVYLRSIWNLNQLQYVYHILNIDSDKFIISLLIINNNCYKIQKLKKKYFQLSYESSYRAELSNSGI